MAESNNCIVAH